MKYRILFLDWYKTLSWSLFWEQLSDPKHPDNQVSVLINEELFRKGNDVVERWMRGEFSSEKIISDLASKLNLSWETVWNTFVDSCEQMKLVSEDIPQVLNLIKKTGTKVLIATDNMDSFRRFTVPSLQLNRIFDGILDSYSLRALKGDFDESGKSLFFSNFLEKAGIAPEECLLIDDSEDKLGKIAGFGIKYRRLDKEENLIEVIGENY